MSLFNLNDKKIAVVGIGGVGGYISAMLAQTEAHLTLVARGERKNSLLQNGLVLHSDYHGELTKAPVSVVSADELSPQDYIFICVKNYSLEAVCKEIAPAVTENTVVIPVMNGVDPGDRIRTLLQNGTVVDSLIYIVAYANDDYSITQEGNFANLRIGIPNVREEQARKVEEVSAILSEAHIDHKTTTDIEAEIWKKYILNCAYNVLTARYNRPIGELRRNPVTAKEYEALVTEAFHVARAKGIHVEQKDADSIIYRFYNELADNATSSLQRDIHSGKPSEFETFGGYIVREAKHLGIAVPVSEKMYEYLSEL